MNLKTFMINRIIAVMLLASVFTFAFVWSNSSASSQSSGSTVEKTSTAEAEEPTSIYEPQRNADPKIPEAVALKSPRRGFPLINLQDGKRLETKFIGSESATQSFVSAQALTMTNSDLNLDGAPDLVVGYGGNGGGHLALYAGNPEALSARTPEMFEAIKEGRFPAPFLPEARLISLPVMPDFVGAGDFNRDGYKDIVAAERGASSLVLLAGNASGNYTLQSIGMPGRVTALLAENIDPADGQPDVAVAISDENGARLFVFDHQRDVFAGQPRVYPLPGEATSLALGQLDESLPMDILAAAGGKAVIIHGSYAETDESATAANERRVEVLNAGADVVAVRVGHFIWDRENRPEIALLTASGKIEILQRGRLDTRQYPEEEWEAHLRAREEQDQIELMRRSADPSNQTVQTNRKQTRQKAQSWSEADSFQLSGGINLESAGSASVFTSTRMTSFGVDDLIISDAANRKIKILVQNNEKLKATGESYSLSAKGGRAMIEMEAAETPSAVLPMRLGVMTRPGLVMLNQESAEISYAVAAPEAVLTVTKTADTFDGACDADCSLREAIRAANLTPGVADLVMVPAGVYTLTLGPSDDSPFDAAAQGSGDLDIRDDLTIMGAGQATTIIQAGTSAATGIDRVLHTRPLGAAILDLSLSGVTIRHGRCNTAGSVSLTSARCNTGGAGLFITGQDGAIHTISDSTITSNWNVATNAANGINQFFLNGAGVYVGRGDMTLNNATVSNNENGAAGSLHGGDGGGLLFGFSSGIDPNIVVMNNCLVTGNIARKIGSDTFGGLGGGLNHAYNDVDINGGTYSNNTADLDGGAFYLLTKTDLFGNASITGNSANRDGGGIFSSGGTFSITSGSVNNNTANSGKGGGIQHNGSSASTISGAQINNNNGSGVHITGTGSLDASNNTITGNSGDGIAKIGTGTGSHFNSNVIHSNGDLGIDLVDDGVTPNDLNDVDSGPNNRQNFPVLNYVRRGDGVANVTLNSPNGQYRIQYYANTTCDPSGHGEGEVLLASEVKDITSGNTITYFSPALAFGVREQITATATHDANNNGNFDDDGNTSEFSACRNVNTLPTITAQPATRQQDSPVSNSQIAGVVDPDQAVNTLTVTVRAVGAVGPGGGSATVNGVTVSNITIDASGNVMADVVANCNAPNANFTLRVTDNNTEFNEATLNVTVTPNTPPTLGNYPNANVSPGGNTTVTPDAAPTDNGSLSSVTATAPGFSGTLSVDSITGVVTVTTANPPGNYTVTVTFTDNCGATTDKTFTLTVNTIPTITGETLSRQQGSPSSNSQIATVNDDDQSEDTLAVTVNGGATVNGVTVSNITVSPLGVVNADVVAACDATNATFTLTVTDSVGASNTATLTVNVTPNTVPTLGNYPDTSVNAGSGTTVTPNATPTDNDSINSLTASAPGFAGTFSGDTTTGVITVSNASPAGNYTVTVTATDNCGATTTKTFTLKVNSPPTANPDSYSTNENTPLNVSAPGVLSNDTDPDTGDTLTAVLVSGPTTASSFTLNADGSFGYTPTLNFFGTDSFTYKAKDNFNAESSPVTVTITVNPVNNPPTVTVVAGGSCDNGGSKGTIKLVISDVDSPAGSATLSGSSSNTAIVPNSNIVFGGSGANRTLTVTPVPVNQSTQNSTVTITVNDGQGGTSTTTITVVVGGNGTQAIGGTSGDDMIFGFNGGDTLYGGAGKDLLCGGNGSDTLFGGEGNDTLDGDNGSDNLYGEGGNDILIGGSSGDFFSGGSGTDMATDFNPGEGDTTDGTLGFLREFADVVEKWAEE